MSEHVPTDEPIPRPQSHEPGSGTFEVTDAVTIVTDATSSGRLLAELIERECSRSLRMSDGGADGPTITLSLIDTLDTGSSSEEAYQLLIDPERVDIEATSPAGLHYGSQALVGLIQERDDGWVLPACEVEDWPETDVRGLLVDPARHFMPVSWLEEIIDQMARAKLNLLHLHLLDSQSYALESKIYPELGQDPETGEKRPVYTHEEMAELVEYAAERNIDLMPELDLPGHATHLIDTIPEVQCQAGQDSSDWTICVGNETTYELVADLVSETAEVFPYSVVHIGGDEYAHQGVSWAECSVCQDRMTSEGFDRPRELFYYFLRRVHDILDAHDRRMMIWNDQIDIANPPDIPDDVLIDFWTVMRPELGPAEGCSMDGFLSEGFETCNSYSPATYMSHWADHELFKAWEPTQLPTISEGNEAVLWGGKLNMWNGPRWDQKACYDYHRRQMPATIPIFGDRVWHGGEPIDDTSLPDVVARHTLGPSFAGDGDIYDELGGVLFPNDLEEYGDIYGSLAGRTVDEAIERYEAKQDLLSKKLDDDHVVFPNTAEIYIDCFDWMINVAEREGRGYRERP